MKKISQLSIFLFSAIICYLYGKTDAKSLILFQKDNFSQWTKVNGDPVDVGWGIKKGVVHRKARGGDIITKEKFKDFELTFEWKISKIKARCDWWKLSLWQQGLSSLLLSLFLLVLGYPQC